MTTYETDERFSLVIPVYNSVASLGELVARVDKVFKEEIRAEYEVVFVDDNSPNPETWPALEAVYEKWDTVRIVQLSRNFGQQSATLCGVAHATGDYVITMDDDLQHLPEEIPNLVAERKHDIVIAQFKKKKHSLFKRITSRMKAKFDELLIGKPRTIQLSSFRLFNRVVADGVQHISTPYPFLPAMMFYISKDVVGAPATHASRAEGRGNYSLRMLFRLFSNLIISNSSLLLRVVGWAGMAFSAFSVLMASYLVFKKLVYQSIISGWTSLIVAILLVGGLVMFALGIIGEYLIRIIAGVENKPTYFVRTSQAPRAAAADAVRELSPRDRATVVQPSKRARPSGTEG
jgi:dolichol-phosphate mannosyltransferase/undecaprenyl-phosphate 4-deoxy-4-formamido-L-arabinose transferase